MVLDFQCLCIPFIISHNSFHFPDMMPQITMDTDIQPTQPCGHLKVYPRCLNQNAECTS